MASPAPLFSSSPSNKRSSKKRLWSSDEDNTLIEFVGNQGPRNWKMIAQNSGLQRDGNSCRFRWKNYLDPAINRGDFTKEEDDIIIKARGSSGNKWSKMVVKLPGRTDNQIKNRWNGHLSKKEQMSEEDVVSNHSEFHEGIYPRPFSNHEIQDFLTMPFLNLESLDFPREPFPNHEIDDFLHELPNLEDQDFPFEVHQDVLPNLSPNLEFNQANLQEPSSDLEWQQDLLYDRYPYLRPFSPPPANHW